MKHRHIDNVDNTSKHGEQLKTIIRMFGGGAVLRDVADAVAFAQKVGEVENETHLMNLEKRDRVQPGL